MAAKGKAVTRLLGDLEQRIGKGDAEVRRKLVEAIQVAKKARNRNLAKPLDASMREDIITR